MNNLFEKYMKLAEEANLSSGTLKSREWFRRIVSTQREIGNINRLVEGLSKPSRLVPGMMIVFYYNAKHAETLSYWDKHPLVMVNSITRDGWTGENFHYMHPSHRARMMYNSTKKRIPVFNQIDPLFHEQMPYCNKKYFAERATMVREVPKEMWELVLQMPFENFQKQSKSFVWKETTKKARRK